MVNKTLMTARAVRRRVKEIKAVAGDPEESHVKEDVLYADVLRAIAEGRCENPAACAREALETEKLELTRWYA